MSALQENASCLGFSQGQLMNSRIVASEEDVPGYTEALEEFRRDADWLFKNAGAMLTTG